MTEKKVSEGLHITEYTINEKDSWKSDRKEIVHRSLACGPVADFAQRIIGHISIATCVPDGCDASGRQQFRMMTPQEVADRACQIAAIAFDQFDERGWLLHAKPPANIVTEQELAAIESSGTALIPE